MLSGSTSNSPSGARDATVPPAAPPPPPSAPAAASTPVPPAPPASDGTTIIAKQRRSAFAKMKRSLTKGPRLLGRRIKHFLKDDLYIDVSYQKAPPKVVTKELAMLEVLSVYHRWLRGVQALLSIAVFILSLLSVGNSATLVNVTLFIMSQATCFVICKTYHVKAQFSGVTNVLFEGRNIFTSPYFPHMVVELALWNIQTPPIVAFGKSFFDLLNYFIFLRLYSVVLYLNNAMYVYRTFCRAMSAISDLPLSTSFMIRTGLIHHRMRVAVTVVVCAWLTVGCLFARTQNTSLGDSLWFSFQALATLGYGDVTATTLSGRAVAFIAWIASYVLLAFLILTLYSLLQASDRSHNMHTLMECHDLVHSLRGRSARVIQMAWRLHKARKVSLHPPTWKQKLYTIAVSSLLTHMIAALRRTRQSLSDAERTFHETNVHPLTGLSAYQYNTYLQTTHRAARQLQRVKDVDRVYLALRDRDVPASSLSRRDIESIIILPGDSLESLEATALPMPLVCEGGGGGGGVPVAELAHWTERIAQLEQKCVRLSEVLEAMSAIAETHPPSMSVSAV